MDYAYLCRTRQHSHRVFATKSRGKGGVLATGSLKYSVFSGSITSLVRFSMDVFFVLGCRDHVIEGNLCRLLGRVDSNLASIVFTNDVVGFHGYIHSVLKGGEGFQGVFYFRRKVRDYLVKFRRSACGNFAMRIATMFYDGRVFVVMFSCLSRRERL